MSDIVKTKNNNPHCLRMQSTIYNKAHTMHEL